MIRVHGVLFLAVLLHALVAFADYSAEIFEMGSAKKTKLFSFQQKVTQEGEQTHLLTEFKDADGKTVIVEKAVLNGAKFVRSEMDHMQTNQKASIEIKDKRVYFTKTTDGKTKTSDEKLGDSFVTPTNFSRFVAENWPALMEGKTIDFRLGSWERMETVGFEIKKIGEKLFDGKRQVELKMRASNFVIAAIVDPLFFQFTEDGKQLLESKGRVTPKKRVGSSWKDLDAETSFSHE